MDENEFFQPDQDNSDFIDIQISVATQELQRCLTHIHQCDNNAFRLLISIALLPALCFVLDGYTKITAVVFLFNAASSPLYTVCLFTFFAAVAGLLVSFISVVFSLLPHYSYKLDRDSVFYFRMTCFKTRDEYCNDFRNLDKDDILDDLLAQIHQYSIIANRKYRCYEWGLKCTTVCFILLSILILIGVCNL